jgi:hypothetical protein
MRSPETAAPGSRDSAQQREDVLAALAGKAADRQREVAQTARRVVLTSLGVLKEQQEGRNRSRSMALAAVLAVALLISPAIWWLVDTLVDVDRLPRHIGETVIWGFFLLTALLAAALVAGWSRNRR